MSHSTTEYKKLKEDFVSNLTGGPISEINYVTAVAPVAALLWSVLQARQSLFSPYTPLSFLVDYLVNVVAILLSFTLYARTPILLNVLLLAPAIFLYALPPTTTGRKKQSKPPAVKPPPASTNTSSALSLKPFLTTYRGSMIVSTVIAILAVDFRLFPRRFAKVETWGTSLMDLGVGSFVFSAGVVAARPILKERAEGRSTPLPRRILYSMRHSLPLLVLGVIRMVSVKGLDYAEHVTEYGVHWNFFFTLGLLPPFVAAFQSALDIIPSYAVLALLVGGLYEVALDTTSLKAYILTAPRIDLISMNREGIFSSIGYLAIFMAGQHIGTLVLPRRALSTSGSNFSSQRAKFMSTIAAWSAGWSLLFFLASSYQYGLGLPVSRRLANLPYILWTAAFNCTMILACAVIDLFLFPAVYTASDAKTEAGAYKAATSPVLRAFNRNGLVIFLLANLLTGLVNMTIPTLDLTPLQAIAVLIVYTAVLAGVAVGLDVYNISVKL